MSENEEIKGPVTESAEVEDAAPAAVEVIADDALDASSHAEPPDPCEPQVEVVPEAPPPKVPHGVYWLCCGEKNLLRIHEDEESAAKDRDDCLTRRTADVERVIPIGAEVHGRKVDAAMQAEHIGSFAIEPVEDWKPVVVVAPPTVRRRHGAPLLGSRAS